MEAPEPQSISTPQIEKESSKLIKENNIKLKDKDEQLYDINFKLFEKSISIEALNENDISRTKYLINLFYQDFIELNAFFNQFSKIEEIFDLLEDMKSEEFKIIKNNNEFIDFYLLIELRKKVIEIPIKLMISKNDINDIVQNLYKIIQDLKNKEIAELQKNNENLEKQILNLNKKIEKLENNILENEKINGSYREKINDDKNKIDEMQKIINNEKERINILEQKSQEDKNKINDLEKKINKNILNDLNKEKFEKIFQQIDNLKNENEKNKKTMELINSGIYDSYKYIINNNINLESILIDKYEFSLINNGIRRQKKANIKKMNLLYRSTRDGGSPKDYHLKCDGHKNLLTLVKTIEGKKFGGFCSLELKNNGGPQKDDTAFIFSLDKRENYYIKKGKSSVYFEKERGPIFGNNLASFSEFHISVDGKNCFEEISCIDGTGSTCCYDYGEARKSILAGTKYFKILDYEVFELEFLDL